VKIEGRIFALAAIFFILVSGTYWYLSRDPIGTTALALSGGLAFLVGFYVLYTSTRVYGFYSPHSWWPFMVGFATFLVVIGLIFAVWVIVFGVVILGIALVGWLFEYYRGDFAV